MRVGMWEEGCKEHWKEKSRQQTIFNEMKQIQVELAYSTQGHAASPQIPGDAYHVPLISQRENKREKSEINQ